MTGKSTQPRWSARDWETVSRAALPAIVEGMPKSRALFAAQDQVFPPERRKVWGHTFEVVASSMATPIIDRLRAEYRKANDLPLQPPARPTKKEERKALAQEQRDRAKLRRSYRGRHLWTVREWALIARCIDDMTANGDTRGDSSKIIDAQDLVLPIERRRPIDSIYNSQSRKGSKQAEHLAQGRAYVWTLAEDLAATGHAPQVTEFIAEPEPEVVVPEPTVVEPQAPTPTESPIVSPFAAEFGRQMGLMVEQLLSAQRQSLLDTMTARANAMIEQVASAVTRNIHTTIGDAVHRLIEAELGGPVQAPAQAHSEPAAPANGTGRHNPHPTSPDRPKRIAIDVVGLIGAQVTEVQDAFRNDPSIDLRFIPADFAGRTATRENVISVTKFVSHEAERKAEKYGSNLVRVNGAAPSVIEAVRQLAGGKVANVH